LKSFARVTKLSNVGGRADYISDPKRQENIVAVSPAVDWKPYQDFERANQKSAGKNNEGREVMIVLPNEWKKLSVDELSKRAQKIAVAAIGKDTDMQWAVHLNEAGTKDSKGNIREVDNLHMHVVFSERTKTGEFSRYDRDVYHTDDGKVARSKAQRAKAADGSEKPPVHRKGDVKGGFSAKDPGYKDYRWKDAAKERVAAEMERMGATIEPPDPIHQYHEGKGHNAPEMRQYNEVIRLLNAKLKECEPAQSDRGGGHAPGTVKVDGLNDRVQRAKALIIELLKKRVFPVFHKVDGKWRLSFAKTADDAKAAMTRGDAAARPAPAQPTAPSQSNDTPTAAPLSSPEPRKNSGFNASAQNAQPQPSPGVPGAAPPIGAAAPPLRQILYQNEEARQLDGMAKFRRNVDLEKPGVIISFFQLKMGADAYRDFMARCRVEGIPLSVMFDKRADAQGRNDYVMKHDARDWERIKGVIDNMGAGISAPAREPQPSRIDQIRAMKDNAPMAERLAQAKIEADRKNAERAAPIGAAAPQMIVKNFSFTSKPYYAFREACKWSGADVRFNVGSTGQDGRFVVTLTYSERDESRVQRAFDRIGAKIVEPPPPERIEQAKIRAAEQNAPPTDLTVLIAAQREFYQKVSAAPPSFHGSLSPDQKAAQNRFCEILREVAPSDSDAVRGALNDAQGDLRRQGGVLGSMADYAAIIELERAIKRELPEPPPDRGYMQRREPKARGSEHDDR